MITPIDHEEQRRQLWCDVAVAFAGSDKMQHKDDAGDVANKTLAMFDKIFQSSTGPARSGFTLPGE